MTGRWAAGPADLFRLEAPLDAALRIWLDGDPLPPADEVTGLDG